MQPVAVLAEKSVEGTQIADPVASRFGVRRSGYILSRDKVMRLNCEQGYCDTKAHASRQRHGKPSAFQGHGIPDFHVFASLHRDREPLTVVGVDAQWLPSARVGSPSRSSSNFQRLESAIDSSEHDHCNATDRRNHVLLSLAIVPRLCVIERIHGSVTFAILRAQRHRARWSRRG